MKIVFANSARINAMERLILPKGRLKSVSLKVRYGIVIHPDQGPILIDTGYSTHSVTAPNRSLMLRLYSRILRPKLIADGQVDVALARFGFTPGDVKTVIVTHFHADHVSGLRAFPNARFVVNGAAWAQVSRNTRRTNLRHGVFTELLPDDFAARTIALQDCAQTADGRDILGDGRLIAVPLPGHAAGHFGVLINADPSPVFYAVDAQWVKNAAVDRRFVGFPARAITDDYAAFKQSSDAVANRIADGQSVVFCHDPDDTAFDLDAGGA